MVQGRSLGGRLETSCLARGSVAGGLLGRGAGRGRQDAPGGPEEVHGFRPARRSRRPGRVAPAAVPDADDGGVPLDRSVDREDDVYRWPVRRRCRSNRAAAAACRGLRQVGQGIPSTPKQVAATTPKEGEPLPPAENLAGPEIAWIGQMDKYFAVVVMPQNFGDPRRPARIRTVRLPPGPRPSGTRPALVRPRWSFRACG